MSITPPKDFRGRPLGGRAAPARVALWRPRNLFFLQFLQWFLIGGRVAEHEAGQQARDGDVWRIPHRRIRDHRWLVCSRNVNLSERAKAI